jgi:hypothetical protein
MAMGPPLSTRRSGGKRTAVRISGFEMAASCGVKCLSAPLRTLANLPQTNSDLFRQNVGIPRHDSEHASNGQAVSSTASAQVDLGRFLLSDAHAKTIKTARGIITGSPRPYATVPDAIACTFAFCGAPGQSSLEWAPQALVGGEIQFPGRSSNGGFWFRKVGNALSFKGD